MKNKNIILSMFPDAYVEKKSYPKYIFLNTIFYRHRDRRILDQYRMIDQTCCVYVVRRNTFDRDDIGFSIKSEVAAWNDAYKKLSKEMMGQFEV